jgi:transposase-like protein
MLTNNQSIEKIAYRQAFGGSARPPSTNENIERLAYRQLRSRVRSTLQQGTINYIVGQEISSMIAEALNTQLAAERDNALGRLPYERAAGSAKRNGFKLLKLPGLWGRLTLRRPVVRAGSLSLPLLEALKAAGTGLRDMLAMRFWLRGCSTRSVAQELNSTIGAKMSHSTVTKVTNAIEPVLREWETRPIPKGIVYLMLDAIYLPVRRPGFIRKQALLVALGITPEGQRHVLGFLLGDKESGDSWSALVKDLLTRGLDRNAIKLVVSDEHAGIEQAVKELLNVPHQLCVVHLMRNATVRVATPHRKLFLELFKNIFWAKTREEALTAAGTLQGRLGAAYPKAVGLTLRRLDDHLRFLNEPEAFQTLLKTSNLIERFNYELRRRLNSAGTMHSELEVSKLLWSISQAQEDRWAKRLWKAYKPREREVATV